MEKYYKVFIEEVAFIDKGRYHSMILDCVRPNGDRFELWMDISERSSRTHLANWRHVRQMLKLYGINIADLAREHFDEKAVWAKVVDKFYRLKLDVTKKGIFMRRVEGIAEWCSHLRRDPHSSRPRVVLLRLSRNFCTLTTAC